MMLGVGSVEMSLEILEICATCILAERVGVLVIPI
jgi:hypothetical protein